MRPLKLFQAPDRYDRADQDRLRNQLEIAFLQLTDPANKVLFQAGQLSTAVAADTTLASFVLPARSIRSDHQGLRVTVNGSIEAAAAITARVRWNIGATNILNVENQSGKSFVTQFYLTRFGSNTAQKVAGTILYSDGTMAEGQVSPAENTDTDLTIAFTGKGDGTKKAFIDQILVEYLAA